jgi:hypothetical protein
MPLEIRPTETAAMVYYVMAQHSELVLLLRERKYSSLKCLFEDVEEVEENIHVLARRFVDQVYFENLHVDEQQEDCQYISDLQQKTVSINQIWNNNKDVSMIHIWNQILQHLQIFLWTGMHV